MSSMFMRLLHMMLYTHGKWGNIMPIGHYHALCQNHKGKAVEIRTRDGKTHRGIIQRVSRSKVYLQPLGHPRSLGGFGYGYCGYDGCGCGGYGCGYGGFGFGLALGSIATLALLPLFFW
jgi:hypothetical protein